ncbi:MAG: hypothetical protein HRT38_12205 [Alteromonadaceae bacterium]|nr:hypothetical protein [Alteromonadaceae bacterium]
MNITYVFAIVVAVLFLAVPWYFVFLIRKNSNEEINNRRENKSLDFDGNIISLNTSIIESLMREGIRLHGERIELDRLYLLGVDNKVIEKGELLLTERTKDFVFRARAVGLIIDAYCDNKIKS